MRVSSIKTTSISLSWSVAGLSVSSSEVMWRDTDREIAESSGFLNSTSYTIDQLESSTIYTVTVSVSTVAGTTESQPYIIFTGIGVLVAIEYTILCCHFRTRY